ncbi:hypothetical protein FA13DRAFT_1714610 [Coprinellus micaceus]|uniref:Uncharacterized protein n=1 Tax=Coprinellus micaceus TaxID=71717 RepID=A0A4Y7SSB9_COPMI|nr:hypothetical protein FA13DRAFT_1714610 [Coprinellus micaceus]
MSISPKAISFPRKARAAGLARRVSSEFTFLAASTSPPRSTIALPIDATPNSPSQSGIQSEFDIAAQGGDATVAYPTTPATPSPEVFEGARDATTVTDNDAQTREDASTSIEAAPAKKNSNKRKTRPKLPSSQCCSCIALHRLKKTKLDEDAAAKAKSEASKPSKKAASSKGQKSVQLTRQAGDSGPDVKENAPVGEPRTKAKTTSLSKTASQAGTALAFTWSPKLEIAECDEGHPDTDMVYCITCTTEYKRESDWLVNKPNWIPKDLWDRVTPWLVHSTLRYIKAHRYLPHESREFTPAEWRLIEVLCVWVATPGFPLKRRGEDRTHPSLEEVERDFNVRIPKGVKAVWSMTQKVRVPLASLDEQLAYVRSTNASPSTPPQDSATVVNTNSDADSGAAGSSSGTVPPVDDNEVAIQVVESDPKGEIYRSQGPKADSSRDSTGSLAPQPIGKEDLPSPSLTHDDTYTAIKSNDEIGQASQEVFLNTPSNEGVPNTPSNDPKLSLEAEGKLLLQALSEDSRRKIFEAAYSQGSIVINSFNHKERETFYYVVLFTLAFVTYALYSMIACTHFSFVNPIASETYHMYYTSALPVSLRIPISHAQMVWHMNRESSPTNVMWQVPGYIPPPIGGRGVSLDPLLPTERESVRQRESVLFRPKLKSEGEQAVLESMAAWVQLGHGLREARERSVQRSPLDFQIYQANKKSNYFGAHRREEGGGFLSGTRQGKTCVPPSESPRPTASQFVFEEGLFRNAPEHGQWREGTSMKECESEIKGAIRRDQGACVRGAWGIDGVCEGGGKIDGDRDVKWDGWMVSPIVERVDLAQRAQVGIQDGVDDVPRVGQSCPSGSQSCQGGAGPGLG